MKDFPNASFPPETVAIMKEAMEEDGERDPATLQRMALLELQIARRD